MRRTTICRSEAALAALFAALLASPVAAQDAPAAQQPQGTEPRPVVPATHTVVQGETLWALAERYYGDPFLWPEIYRLNTDVVEDPHWIFPGEELRLAAMADTTEAPSDTVGVVVDQGYAVQPAGDTTQAEPVPSTAGRTIFFPSAEAAPRRENYDFNVRAAYRAVRRGEYFSAGFLTEGQPLNSGRVSAKAERAALRALATRQSAQYFEDAVVDEPPGEPLQQGDLLLTFERGDEIEGYGELILPTGLLRVAGQMGNRYRATVIQLFSQVSTGQELIKVAPFVYNTSQRAQPVAEGEGVDADVVAVRDQRAVMMIQDVLFINRGSDDGVRLGDVFQIYAVRRDEVRGGEIEQDQARALVVNVRSRTATVLIVELYRGDIRVGSRARQVRRMPS